MWFYLAWVPIVSLHYGIYSYLSKMNNDTKEWKWAVAAAICGATAQYWALVSRYTHNIIFDAIVYDLCIVIPGFAVLIYMGAAANSSTIHWIGMVLAIIGIVLMKV